MMLKHPNSYQDQHDDVTKNKVLLLKPGYSRVFCLNKYTMIELGLYEHYKGKTYNVIGVAIHSETLEKMVVYEATYQTAGENLWVRPLNMFTEKIIVNNVEVPRFKKIN